VLRLPGSPALVNSTRVRFIGRKGLVVLGVCLLVLSWVSSGAAHPTKAADSLTGFGATIAHWNQHHTPDTKYAKNSVYDPGPGLGDNGSAGDRYFGATPLSGRMELYDLRLDPGTPIAAAKAEVLASEFPSDAKITWFKVKDTCAQMLVRSKTLEHTIHHFALVEFSSGDAADHYTPRDASQLVVTIAFGNGRSMDC
jgi:hypothetical protein